MIVHRYTAGGAIDVTLEGQRMSVPDDMRNSHRQMVAAWEAEGNTIPAYVTDAEIRAEADRRIKALAPEYTEAERETWTPQVAEARNVIAGGQSAALDLLAAPRGVTTEELAQVIIAKEAALFTASAAILAKQETLLRMSERPQGYTDDEWWT